MTVSYTHLDVYKRQELDTRGAEREKQRQLLQNAGSFWHIIIERMLERGRLGIITDGKGCRDFLRSYHIEETVLSHTCLLYTSRYWKDVHGTEYLDDVKALNLMPDKNGKKSYPMWGYAWSESFINASVSDEKLDKILQLYDYLLSDEGALLSTYGPEGELYDMKDGKVTLHNPCLLYTSRCV